MDFFRTTQNPWGEDIFVGLAWNVLWLVVGAGAAFILVHGYLARAKRGGASAAQGGAHPSQVERAAGSGLPERIERHGGSARASHWVMAAATLALLITAFVPMLGLRFPWVTVHWIAGVVLAAYVLYHTLDTAVRRSWGGMWIGVRDVASGLSRTGDFLRGRGSDPSTRSGKWNLENKLFHHLTALAGLAVVASGVLMMARIDTWFWEANPYFRDISDAAWGMVFVVHGASAVGFVGLLMAHIYFALRPEKLWFTRSMLKGWITREEYLTHFDPARWRVSRSQGASPPPEEAAVVGAAHAAVLAGGPGAGSAIPAEPEGVAETSGFTGARE